MTKMNKQKDWFYIIMIYIIIFMRGFKSICLYRFQTFTQERLLVSFEAFNIPFWNPFRLQFIEEYLFCDMITDKEETNMN